MREIQVWKDKTYQDYVLEAIRKGQKEYIKYLPRLSRDKAKPFDDGIAAWIIDQRVSGEN